MYDRAPRKIGFHVGDTAEIVGPGSYELDKHGRRRRKVDGYAPFGSMTGRDSMFQVRDQVVAAPGPGYYDAQSSQSHVVGGRALANTSRRFNEYHGEKNPGPGTYETQKHQEFGTNPKSAPTQTKSKDKGQLYSSSRVKYTRKPEAPSIPMPGLAYGFEENEDGTLKKQGPPDRDTSIGPAFYNIKNQSKPTQQYKGNHWGNMTSQRFNAFAAKGGPGPGEYEAASSNKAVMEHTHLRTETKPKPDPSIPRYHQQIEKDNVKKNIPGPGKYTIRGQFDEATPKINMDGIEVEHPPFGSQSKRFQPLKAPNPGPGTYNDPRHALEVSKKPSGMKRSPFGTTAVRFHENGAIKAMPGPGSYHSTGLGAESIRRAYVESTRRGVFGTTAVRIQPMSDKTSHETPGPAHYQVKEKMHQPRYQQMTSNFASVSSRFKDAPDKSIEEEPGPGAYNVHPSFAQTQLKRQPGEPRTDAGRRRKGAFATSASRFADIPDPSVKKTDVTVPGPGQYNRGEKWTTGNMVTSQDKRFKYKSEETPGPGQYEFSPLIQDTVVRGTFNATLNNPVMEKMETGIAAATTGKQAFLLGV